MADRRSRRDSRTAYECGRLGPLTGLGDIGGRTLFDRSRRHLSYILSASPSSRGSRWARGGLATVAHLTGDGIAY